MAAERSMEEMRAGYEFRESIVKSANTWQGGAPLWHGWAIMDAFLAGIDWARAEAGREPPKNFGPQHLEGPGVDAWRSRKDQD